MKDYLNFHNIFQEYILAWCSIFNNLRGNTSENSKFITIFDIYESKLHKYFKYHNQK